MQLFQGDCLIEMKNIPDKSIDMILCDLPYGTTECKWDVVIPFEPLWEQYNRIIKMHGCIALFGQEPFSSYLRMSNIRQYKYDWIWIKNGNSGDFAMAKNKPLSKHESIVCFSKASFGNGAKNRMNYNPQDLIKIEPKIVNKKEGGISTPHRPGRKEKIKTFTTEHTNYPSTILSFNKDKGLHPTQKPVALLEYLIKTYTLEGETVLDNTMGSGSTGVACVNTNRNFIGIELDKNYFTIAKERIEQTVKDKKQELNFEKACV